MAGNLTGDITKPGSDMFVASAAERNKQPILDVLRKYLPPARTRGLVLEVASGTGQHIAHFAPHFPDITWQPSDIDKSYLKSISAFIDGQGLKNVLQPIQLDITKSTDEWASEHLKSESCDLIYNSNMVHISPWEASVGLFKVAGYLLKPGSVLFMYGPFKMNGILTPQSNVQFDASLRHQDASWGVRDLADLEKLAKENGLKLETMVDMPSNNKSVVYRKM